MTPIQANNYPFVKEFLANESGEIRKVILKIEDYRRLLEALEDEELYQAMQAVRHEVSLSLSAALPELDSRAS